MNRFYFGSDSASSNGDDTDDLPFPAPLPRNDFLKPDFDPSTYLSSLGHRHQTLEDLREDLRTRSQLLNKELLDLVNTHHEDFLSLGSSLHGGNEKIEELRVGLMAFRREVEEIKKQVARQGQLVDGLLGERIRVKKEIALCRQLLDLNARVNRLENRLMVVGPKSSSGAARRAAKTNEDEEEEESSDDESAEYNVEEGDDVMSLTISRLRRSVQEVKLVEQLIAHVDHDQPLIASERARLMRVRSALLIDLGTALKQARATGDGIGEHCLTIFALYRDLDEAVAAVNALGGDRI